MMEMMRNKKKKKGFTLIELVVVIAILGILSAIAIPRFTGTQETAKLKTHLANIRTIESAITLYQAENGKLPAASTDLTNNASYLKEWPAKPGTYTLASGGALTASPTKANTELVIGDSTKKINWSTGAVE